MKTRYMTALALAGALLAAPLSQSWAATQDAPGFYAGAGIGYYSVDENDFFGPGIDLDDEEFAYKGYVGYNFLPWLGVEGGFVSFREAGGNAEFESDGWTIAAIGYLPMGNFAPYVKVGQYFWDSDASSIGLDGSDDGNDPFAGIGVLFKLTDAVDLRAEYERYQVDTDEKADLDMVSLNAQIRF